MNLVTIQTFSDTLASLRGLHWRRLQPFMLKIQPLKVLFNFPRPTQCVGKMWIPHKIQPLVTNFNSSSAPARYWIEYTRCRDTNSFSWRHHSIFSPEDMANDCDYNDNDGTNDRDKYHQPWKWHRSKRPSKKKFMSQSLNYQIYSKSFKLGPYKTFLEDTLEEFMHLQFKNLRQETLYT